MKIKPEVKKIIEQFPTNTKRMLSKDSYFWIVYDKLLNTNSFLEIGYRKGLFVEICKIMNIRSVHVDIDDALLKANPTKSNQCHTMSSIDYLKKCSDQFNVVFQDGSKDFKVRKKEYDLLFGNSILEGDYKIICDDLHYSGCQKAFDYAKSKYKLNSSIYNVKDKSKYQIGLLWKNKR